MMTLTLYDWLWLSFVVAICLYAVLRTWHDRKESKRELKDAETFQQQIDEIKHKNIP